MIQFYDKCCEAFGDHTEIVTVVKNRSSLYRGRLGLKPRTTLSTEENTQSCITSYSMKTVHCVHWIKAEISGKFMGGLLKCIIMYIAQGSPSSSISYLLGFSVLTVLSQPISVCNTYAVYAGRWWNVRVSILPLDVSPTLEGRELQSACFPSHQSCRKHWFLSLLVELPAMEHLAWPLLSQKQAAMFPHQYQLLGALRPHQGSGVQGSVGAMTRWTATASQELSAE